MNGTRSPSEQRRRVLSGVLDAIRSARVSITVEAYTTGREIGGSSRTRWRKGPSGRARKLLDAVGSSRSAKTSPRIRRAARGQLPGTNRSVGQTSALSTIARSQSLNHRRPISLTRCWHRGSLARRCAPSRRSGANSRSAAMGAVTPLQTASLEMAAGTRASRSGTLLIPLCERARSLALQTDQPSRKKRRLERSRGSCTPVDI